MTEHDPGGKSRFLLPDGVRGGARFEGKRCEHRIWLTRSWLRPGEFMPEPSLPFALWVCHNPSTAGADEDDPLVRKVVAFTRRQTGLSCLILCNLATYRCTTPSDLKDAANVRHPSNLDTIRTIAEGADRIVVAWGVPHPSVEPFVERTLLTLRFINRPILCLGRTKDNWPRHPGRIGYDTKLEPY